MNDLSHTNETSASLDDTGCVAFAVCVGFCYCWAFEQWRVMSDSDISSIIMAKELSDIRVLKHLRVARLPC